MSANSNPSGEDAKMPEEMQHAFLEILAVTLLHIRGTKSNDLTFTLSDHAHNIPRLIDKYSPGAFRYYWEIERNCFLVDMGRLGEPFGAFEEQWAILEKHYENLPPDRAA